MRSLASRGWSSSKPFVDASQVLNGQVAVIDAEVAGRRFVGVDGQAQVVDDAHQVRVGQLLLCEKGMGLGVEEAAVVGGYAVSLITLLDEDEQAVEVFPKRRGVAVVGLLDPPAELAPCVGRLHRVPGPRRDSSYRAG